MRAKLLTALLVSAAMAAAPAFASGKHYRGHGHHRHHHYPVKVVHQRPYVREVRHVYYEPAPVYYAPAPVIYHEPRHGGHHDHDALK